MKLNEKYINNIVKGSINNFLLELHHTTYQNAAQQAFDYGDDNRVYAFRKQAEKGFSQERFNRGNHVGGVNDYQLDKVKEHNENWIKLNNGKKLVIFDDEYKSLQDLYNGVKCGKLLIHARGMVGDISNNMRYIEPSFSETLLQHYANDYDRLYDSKKEFYGDDFDDDGVKYPELIFASDDFTWCHDERNGIFFIESDGFQKSLGDGMIQLPNGRICKYWEGDVYDYDNELYREEPICCEYGDWYSNKYATVVAVMNIK